MFDLAQHFPLVIRVFDLLHLDHLCLLQHFDGVESLVVPGLYEMYPTETTGSEGSQDLKVGERVFALGLPSLLQHCGLMRLGRRAGCGLLSHGSHLLLGRLLRCSTSVLWRRGELILGLLL